LSRKKIILLVSASWWFPTGDIFQFNSVNSSASSEDPGLLSDLQAPAAGVFGVNRTKSGSFLLAARRGKIKKRGDCRHSVHSVY
jgi:hypothetical protein